MLSTPMLDSLYDELEKIAYGEEQHAELTRRAMGSMGANPGLINTAVKGSLKTDTGMRHPWIPGNTYLHSMPGQSRISRLREVVKMRRKAVDTLSSAAARGGGIGHGAQVQSGVANLGQATHALADVYAHHDKPAAAGFDVMRGGRVAKVPGIGTALSGLEHARSGLTPTAGAPKGDLDRLSTSAADVMKNEAESARGVRGAVKRVGQKVIRKVIPAHQMTPEQAANVHNIDVKAQGAMDSFGKSTHRRIMQKLVKQHGMSPGEAELAAKQLLGGQAPGRLSRLAGEAARNVGHLKSHLGRSAGRLAAVVR